MKMHKPEKNEGFENGEFERAENNYYRNLKKSNRIEKDLYVEFQSTGNTKIKIMKNEIEELRKDAYDALNCLYITVESNIADDVNKKVLKYIYKLEEQALQMSLLHNLTFVREVKK